MARSAEGAVLINMSWMDAVHADPARRLARVEGPAVPNAVPGRDARWQVFSAGGSTPDRP
jgi:hypothetical protein